MRTQVAVWADVTVVEKLSAWHGVYDKYVPNAPPGIAVALSAAAKAAFERATAEVVQAVRKDLLASDSASTDQLVNALFNKPAGKRTEGTAS